MSINAAELALAAIAAVLAITLHEAAHGFAALAMGDDTARRAGRLSLNPLRHVDPIGTVVLPGLLVLGQLRLLGHVGFMFGWAKPVPVAAWKFRNPRRGMMVVAAAGPAMNFLLAWIGALFLPDKVSALNPLAGSFLLSFLITNLILGLFNLIPVPPLDGGRIAVGLLPLRLAQAWARLERVGLVLVLLLVFALPPVLGNFGIDFDPIRGGLNAVLPRAWRVVLFLSGHTLEPGADEHFL